MKIFVYSYVLRTYTKVSVTSYTEKKSTFRKRIRTQMSHTYHLPSFCVRGMKISDVAKKRLNNNNKKNNDNINRISIRLL